MDLSDSELLNYAVLNGMIDIDTIRTNIEMNERNRLLSKHTFCVWQGKDGFWRTYLPDVGGRRMVKRSSKETVEDAIIDFWKEQEENPTLKVLFDLYNDGRLENNQISKASHTRYEQDFNRFYKPIENRRIRSFSADELCDYIEKREAELDLTSRAFCNVKTITKGMFKRAYRKKWIAFRIEEEVLQVLDMSERSFKKNYKEDYQEVFNENEFTEYTKFLSDHPDPWNLALLLSFVTGLRSGEIVALSYEDLIDNGDFFALRVRHTETRYKENGKYIYEIKDAPKTDAGIRQAIVPKQYYWLYETLVRGKEPGDWIFTSPRTNRRFTTNCLRRRQERNCKKLLYYHKSPHKNRKTYGSILLDNNLDSALVIQQMGHVDIQTTERFYHRNMKSIEKKADIISSIDIFSA